MRRKLIALLFALVAAAVAQGLFSTPSSEAASCPHLVCCPKGPCYCCPYPCLIQCP
jgi:hypothetical protein